MKLNKILEILFIFIFITLFLWSGIGRSSAHQLTHDLPTGYLHRDSIEHYLTAKYISEEGNYKYSPPYLSEGYDNIIGIYPHRPQALSAIFAINSGLETFDTLPLLVHIFALFATLTIYLIIRRYDQKLAYLSLPFALTFYINQKTFWVFVQGDWPSLAALSSVVFFIWAFDRIQYKHISILAALFLSSIVFDHLSHGFLVFLFLILFFIFNIIRYKEINFTKIKKLSLIGLYTFILSCYYLFLTKFIILNTRNTEGLFGGFTLLTSEFNLGFLHFKPFIPILILGILTSLIWLWKKKDIIPIIGFTFLIGSYSYLFGFSRATELSTFLPIGFAIFFGYGIYSIFYIFKLKKFAILISLIISVTLLFSFPNIYDFPNSRYTSIDPIHYQNLLWIRESTPENATFYFFYSPTYYEYYNSNYHIAERLGYNVLLEEFHDASITKQLKRRWGSYTHSVPLDFNLPYWSGPFKLGFKKIEENIQNKGFDMDICNIDYFVFDIIPIIKYPHLIEYNNFIRNEMLKKGHIEEVINNQVVSILRNNKPGEDCIT